MLYFWAMMYHLLADEKGAFYSGLYVEEDQLKKITVETAAMIRELRQITNNITISLHVGNHAIILEHDIAAWAGLQHVPFLDATSGTERSQIEHGHS